MFLLFARHPRRSPGSPQRHRDSLDAPPLPSRSRGPLFVRLLARLSSIRRTRTSLRRIRVHALRTHTCSRCGTGRSVVGGSGLNRGRVFATALSPATARASAYPFFGMSVQKKEKCRHGYRSFVLSSRLFPHALCILTLLREKGVPARWFAREPWSAFASHATPVSLRLLPFFLGLRKRDSAHHLSKRCVVWLRSSAASYCVLCVCFVRELRPVILGWR